MKKVLIIAVLMISIIVFLFLLNEPVEFQDTYIKSDFTNFNKDIFTEKEIKWIEENRDREFIVGVAQDYIPIEYLDMNEEPKGLGIELIKKVNEYTGLNFKLYENSGNEIWEKILQRTKGKKIDILTAVSYTEKRSEYLVFSKPYIEMTQVLIGNKGKEIVSNYNKLDDATFAVPKGYWYLDTILKKHDEDKIIHAKNTKEAINTVAQNKADYTICELPVYTYYKENSGHNNIKIVGLLDKNPIHIGVRKESKELIPIINKVLNDIDNTELYERALVMPEDDTKEAKLIFAVILLITFLVIIIYYLITTYRKLIKAKREAEEANRDKIKLMANISHDLKTPITVTMGFLEAIIDGEVHKEEGKEEYLKRSYSKLKHLGNLIDDFFFLSRIEDNKVTFNKEKLNINNILENVGNNLEFQARSNGIHLTMKLDNSIPLKSMDRLKFYRAMENLIINAIRYNKEKGTVEVGTIALKDGKIKIYIKDSGLGIHQKDIPHLFKRNYKGKNARKDSNGLGLYITKEIIEKHDGKIWVESKLNEGTTFYIVL